MLAIPSRIAPIALYLKSIRRNGNKPAGAILGFANLLLRLYADEKPRAVLVAWDTLEAETCRHAALKSYQQGRQFDDELVEQLDVIPEFVTACGFPNIKATRYEADDFLAAACKREEKTFTRTQHCPEDGAGTICGLEFFGVDHSLFATDAPFGPEGGRAFIRATIDVMA